MRSMRRCRRRRIGPTTKLNVAPFGHFASSAVYRRRTDLCSDAAPLTEPFATMVTLRVRAGEQEQLESRWKARKIEAVCFELLSGGSAPAFLILKPASSFSAAVTWRPPFDDRAVESMTIEALRYRPDLTYLPPHNADTGQ